MIALSVRPDAGGRLVLTNSSPGKLILAKADDKTSVPVLSKELVFSIDKKVDDWGMVPFVRAAGKIAFGAYTFQGKTMPAVTVELLSGSGYLNVNTGEASLEYIIPLKLPDGSTENMVFTGTGQYNRENNTFTLNTDMTGISQSFLKSNVPEDTKKNKEK